jgi:hypothetical protein
VPLEGGAEGVEGALQFRLTRLLGMQRIAFLLDDFINVLVAAAQLFEEPPQFDRIVDALRGELAHLRRRAVGHQLRDALRVEAGEGLTQVSGIAAQAGHGQQGVGAAGGGQQVGKHNGARIDEFGEAFLRRAFGGRACGAGVRRAGARRVGGA